MKVMPLEPASKSVSPWSVESFESPGCLFGITFLAVGFGLGGFPKSLSTHTEAGGVGVLSVILVCAMFSCVPVAFFEVVRKVILARKRTAEAQKAELDRVTHEAQSLTNSLKGYLSRATEHRTKLVRYLQECDDWLSSADVEYRASAYAPFWDAVEQSALRLAKYNSSLRALNDLAEMYYQGLRGRTHSFSAFDYSEIPDPSSQIRRFNAVVRRGQTNYKFATIWEHRATREAVVAGFRTLGDAISGIEQTLSGSVNQLQNTISSGLRDVRVETSDGFSGVARKIDDQNRMLDNVQRGRKPGFLE